MYLHAPYLANVASPEKDLREKSVENLSSHLAICEVLDAQGLIFHIGSGKEMPKQEALTIVVEEMKKILKKVPGTSRLIIENSAGGGQKIGSSAREIGDILKRIGSPRVKVCLDTAHAFEAGVIETYSQQGVKTFFDEWDKEVGCENIVALHVNDSKTVFNSHHDRHENIGQGYIGLAGFEQLAKEKRIHHTAWLLEVPGFDNGGPDKRNVDILKKLFKK